MKFRVEIECDNAAFQLVLQREIRRILDWVGRADVVKECDYCLMDYNGNTVGRAWCEEDEDTNE